MTATIQTTPCPPPRDEFFDIRLWCFVGVMFVLCVSNNYYVGDRVLYVPVPIITHEVGGSSVYCSFLGGRGSYALTCIHL